GAVEVELVAVAADSKSKRRTRIKILLLDHLVILDIPDPPLGFPVGACADLGHHRITALAIRRKLESVHRQQRTNWKIVHLASGQVDLCEPKCSFVDDGADGGEHVCDCIRRLEWIVDG